MAARHARRARCIGGGAGEAAGAQAVADNRENRERRREGGRIAAFAPILTGEADDRLAMEWR